MEKIYMNKNNDGNHQSTFQQIFKSQLSKKMSITMALVAFFSFLLIGIGNVSYAAPVEIPDGDLGDSIVTQTSNVQVIGSSTPTFSVQMYYTTVNGKSLPIFCLERDVDFVTGKTLTKSGNIEDQGLLHVMANSFPHVKFADSSGNPFPDEVQTWITQAAIWEYLNGSDFNVSDDKHNMEQMKTIREIYYGDSPNTKYCDVDGCYDSETQVDSTETFYQKYIAELVANAKQAGVSTSGVMQMSKQNDEISITDDEKYYQSSEITVSNTPPNSILEFSVSIEAAPDGTILVNENGQEVESTKNLSKFYVRVPVDKVTEENKTVKLKATGTFRGYDGYYYRAEGAQTVSTVFTTDVKNDTGLEFTLNYTPEVPSTGMNMAQSVYFIGLVVLLCGVGIIYANAKPKSKQQ